MFESGHFLVAEDGTPERLDEFDQAVSSKRVCRRETAPSCGNIRLAMWPAKLKPQYEFVCSDPNKVEALAAIAELPHRDIGANFHLTYWLAAPAKRW